MYAGPVQKALTRYRSEKSSWRIVEDNDPTGFKSKVAMATKARLGMVAMEWPKYSPDLHPLDFALWADIDKRARQAAGSRQMSAKEYKRVLRQTALRYPATLVRRAVESMRARINAVYHANGSHTARD